MEGRMRAVAWAWGVLTLACVACGAAGSGATASTAADTGLKVVTFTPPKGTVIPLELVATRSMRFSATVHDGYACLVTGQHPMVWPAGYAARVTSGGIEVRDASGTVVVRAGAEYEFSQYNEFSKGDACAAKGREVIVVLKVTTLADRDWVPLG